MLNSINPGTFPAQIDIAIIPANFEFVRDQIGSLLKVELDNQAAFWGDEDLTSQVFIERFTPIDRAEGNCIEVGIMKMGFDNQTPISQRNGVDYAIDVFVNALEKGDDDGCYLSGAKLHRLAGLIRSIIQNPIYDKLGFAPGLIERRSIQNIQFAQKEDNHDTLNSRMARITLHVDMHEESSGIVPKQLISYLTVVKLAMTEKGYEFIYSNT